MVTKGGEEVDNRAPKGPRSNTMTDRVKNRVREQRDARGISQMDLAERSGLTRQSIGAIESGKATPAVDVALRIARALDCQVEDLFGQTTAPELLLAERDTSGSSSRAMVARVAGRWVAYPMTGDAITSAADGLVAEEDERRVRLEPLRTAAELQQNLVTMGCAAGLGLLADRLNSRPGAGRFLWFSRSSTSALAALAEQRTHIAGVHLVDEDTGEANIAAVKRTGCVEPVVLITLARWEAGFVSRRKEADRIESPSDLGRPGLRVVGRETGAGAQQLLERTVRDQRLPLDLARRPLFRVGGHLDVARAVAIGAADTGVATRDAALAFGLSFLSLAEERYDLAVPRSALVDGRVQRLLNVLVSGEFRRELAAIGYDIRAAGDRVAEIGPATRKRSKIERESANSGQSSSG